MNLKTALKMADVLVDGLDVMQGITNIGGDDAAKALAAVAKVIATLKEGVNGTASPQAVSAEIDALFTAIAGNDAAADEALRKKFGQ